MLRALCLLALLGACTVNAALFTQLPTPQWTPRILQGWAFPTSSVTYTPIGGSSTTASPGNTLLAFGGSTYNDSYISTDSANSWTLIGGVGVTNTSGRLTYTPSTHPASFTPDDSGACKAYDGIKNQYYVLDSTYAWISSNGLDWTAASPNEYAGRQSAACVVDPASNLYVLGGQNTSSSAYENDIWQSANQGSSFTRVGVAPWSQRDSMRATAAVQPLGKTILTAIGGHAKIENIRPNEVWVSSDSAATWTLLAKAPFVGRDHFTSLLTSNNVMVVVAGKSDVTVPAGHLGMNDVWASLDGGATWGACSQAAEFPVRQDSTLAIDNNGYLYVSGGTSNTQTGSSSVTLNDVWRSTISFTDINSVMSQCFGGAAAPVCSIGLRCWPNATSIVSNTSSSGTYPVPTAAPYSCPCTSGPNNNNGVGVVRAEGMVGLAMMLLAVVMMWM